MIFARLPSAPPIAPLALSMGVCVCASHGPLHLIHCSSTMLSRFRFIIIILKQPHTIDPCSIRCVRVHNEFSGV